MDKISNIRSMLDDKNSAVLITSFENRYYFSGFFSSAGAVLITNKGVYLLVDFRYYEAAQKTVNNDIITVIKFDKITKAINNIIKADNVSSLIIEDKYVCVADYNAYTKNLDVPIVSDFSLSDKLLELRMIKTQDEISKIKTAQKITEKSYSELLNFIKAGVTERQIATELEHLMKLNGAQKTAFDIIAVSGKNSSLPHGVPTDKKLSEGDFLTLDIGVVYDGYHSDMTRTVAVHHATDEMQRIYNIVLNAHYKARDAIAPGATCADVDNAARDYIYSQGYGEYFGHSTGHGVGLEIHEKPVIYKTNDLVLHTGMVITNEPGIYLPDNFGVRIEDMYLVTDNGYEDLANIDKELLIL